MLRPFKGRRQDQEKDSRATEWRPVLSQTWGEAKRGTPGSLAEIAALGLGLREVCKAQL